MQLNPLDTATLAGVPTGAGATARVVAGNLAAVPVGELLQATVTTVSPREAVLNVNGQQLTVRPPAGQPLQPGAVLFVRVPPTATNAPNPTLELAVPAANQKPLAGVTTSQKPVADVATGQKPLVGAPARAPVAPTTVALPQLAVVDVLAPLPDGRVRVQIDGVEQVATAAEPLATGGRYLLQVERSPVGIRLTPPPETPALPTEVATAVLRTPAPTLPATIKPLQAELATLAAAPAPGGTVRPVPVAVREAAVAVQTTLRAFLPSEPSPPDATQLRQLVENGGLHFEAKLARLVAEPDVPNKVPISAPAPNTTKATPTPNAPNATKLDANVEAADPTKPGNPAKPQAAKVVDAPVAVKVADAPLAAKVADAPQTASRVTTETASVKPQAADAPDLKGDLLRLLQAVHDVGGAARAPAAEAAVRGIESQQAANALAQANGTPYFLQVPFPDGGEWRTLHLSLEPQHRPDQADAERAGRFRVFMHVPLTDLGETWIDAGLAGEQFRATIYLDRAGVRDRVRAALPELRTELQADGFSEVLIDVRSSSELPERHRREAGAMQAGRPDTVSVLDVRA